MRLNEVLQRSEITSDGVQPRAYKIVHDTLAAIPGSDFLRPYYKNIKLNHPHGQENLLNVRFVAPLNPGIRVAGPGKRYDDHDRDERITKMKPIAQRLLDTLEQRINIEDSQLSVTNGGLVLFMVSDDFIGGTRP